MSPPDIQQRAGLHTEVDHIKHLGRPILRYSGEELPIRTCGDGRNGRQMGTVVFNEFNTLILFLPQLQVSVNRGRDEELSPMVHEVR